MTKSEKTGFKTSLFLFVCLFVHYAINRFLTPKSVDDFNIPLWLDISIDVAWILLYGILLYKIMTGKKWAKIVLNIFLVLGFITSIGVILYFFEFYEQNLFINIFFQLFYILMFSYLNFSKDFKAYIQYIRTYKNLILP